MKKLLLLLCALLLTACNKSTSTATSSTAGRNYSQVTAYYGVQWQFQQEDMHFYIKYQNADVVKEWTVYLTGFYRLSVSSTPLNTLYECEINNSQVFDYYLIII